MQMDFTFNSIDLASHQYLDSNRNSFAFSPRKSPIPNGGASTPLRRGTELRYGSTLASPTNSSLNATNGGDSIHLRHASVGDRFIPNRDMQDSNLSHYFLTSPSHIQMPSATATNDSTDNAYANVGLVDTGLDAASPAFAGSPNASPNRTSNQNRLPNSNRKDASAAAATSSQPYARSLAKALFSESAAEGQQASVLSLQSPNRPSLAVPTTRPSACDAYERSQGVVYQENRARGFQSKSFRVIPQTPERILDAPELLDDFYLNLLDWSSGNTMAVALGNTAYLWNAEDGSIVDLMSSQRRDNIITAVSWHGDGKTLAIGLNDGTVQLWNPETKQLVRSISGHAARVCSLSWNGGLLASGSRDTSIHMHDERDPFVAGNVHGHTQEVCGLRWSPNGSQLASGGNDNLLNVWDFRRTSMEIAPLWRLDQHKAAVKALAWNPCQPNLLVSGGGTADKTLRFWDTSKGECVNMIDTLSQVCGVLWNHDGTELVSSHGYSDNQLTLWRYPTLTRITDLIGHTSRVLHLTMSPDGQTVVSAAGDETIRFWRCFAPDRSSMAASHPFGIPYPTSPDSRKSTGASPSTGAGCPMLFDDYNATALR
eukprot:GILI01008248.1.p1 GENE.GILI01008248.1~~GILI01008248.1.p1  ORF type:complete len:598 (-),score=120.08 GILI01008248.1:184-1977(-)